MSWLDVCLWWRLRGRRSGAALMDFQWRRRHALDRRRRREPHAGEPRVLERRREWDRPARQARSFLRNEVGPGCNGGPFNRGHHANRLVLSQGRGGACLAADYCARVQNDSNGSHFYLPSRGQADDTIKYIKNISYLDYSTSALQQGHPLPEPLPPRPPRLLLFGVPQIMLVGVIATAGRQGLAQLTASLAGQSAAAALLKPVGRARYLSRAPAEHGPSAVRSARAGPGAAHY